MVRRVLSFVFASALFLMGLWGAYDLLFLAERVPLGLLMGAGVFGMIGAYWLWADFIAPWLGHKATE